MSVIGDLKKTAVIHKLLLQDPGYARTQGWNRQFLENLPEADFRCSDPQVIMGPDGFPYFQLLLPEPNVGFDNFCILQMKDDFLLSDGLGVVINPKEPEPDWVLTYGDILNLHLNGVFYLDSDQFVKLKNTETIPTGTQLVSGQPAEAILPSITRQVLRRFFQNNGIHNPKVVLLYRNNPPITGIEIFFNITPAQFPSEEVFYNFLNAIKWFLPRHYAVASADEKSIEGFQPL